MWKQPSCPCSALGALGRYFSYGRVISAAKNVHMGVCSDIVSLSVVLTVDYRM